MPWPSLHGKPESSLQTSEKPVIASPKLGMVNINVTQSGQKKEQFESLLGTIRIQQRITNAAAAGSLLFQFRLDKNRHLYQADSISDHGLKVMTEEGHMAVRAMETKF